MGSVSQQCLWHNECSSISLVDMSGVLETWEIAARKIYRAEGGNGSGNQCSVIDCTGQ